VSKVKYKLVENKKQSTTAKLKGKFFEASQKFKEVKAKSAQKFNEAAKSMEEQKVVGGGIFCHAQL
jgi:hypothetical protein